MAAFRFQQFPKSRLTAIDILEEGRRKHHIAGLIVLIGPGYFIVTRARRISRRSVSRIQNSRKSPAVHTRISECR